MKLDREKKKKKNSKFLKVALCNINPYLEGKLLLGLL
jgi:hypothetical protein